MYTNHSIRVTVVTTLYEAGFDNSKIQSITGHKTSSSVDRYKRLRSDDAQYDGFSALAKRMCSHTTEGEKSTTSARSTQPFTLELEEATDAEQSAVSDRDIKPEAKITDTGSSAVAHLTANEARDDEKGQSDIATQAASVLRSLFGGCNLQVQQLHIHMK